MIEKKGERVATCLQLGGDLMRAFLLATVFGCAALMAAPAPADASWLSQALRGGGGYGGYGGYGSQRSYYGGYGGGYYSGHRSNYYATPYYGHGGYGGYQPYSSYNAAPYYSNYGYAPRYSGYYSGGYYCR